MGATIKEQFSDDFLYNRFILVTGTAAVSQLMTGSCSMIRFKADPDNNDDFLIGNADIQPFKLASGDDTGWNSATELNDYYYTAVSGNADYMTVWYKV